TIQLMANMSINLSAPGFDVNGQVWFLAKAAFCTTCQASRRQGTNSLHEGFPVVVLVRER
ncbi:hypothetical protein CBR_g66183, partial [Chara braunii]